MSCSFASNDLGGFRNYNTNFTIHFILNMIRAWSSDISFFINFKFLRVFDSIIKNKLKNITKKFVTDECLLVELNKIISLGLGDFSKNDVYTISFDTFPRFFLEIILVDFDVFLDSLNNNHEISVIRKSLQLGDKRTFSSFIPVRLDNVLFEINSLNFLFRKTFLSLEAKFLMESRNFTFSYKRLFSFIRFMDHSLVGLIGSKNFISNFTNNIYRFIRSRMHLDIEYLDTYLSNEKFIFFAGFNIRLCLIRLFFHSCF